MRYFTVLGGILPGKLAEDGATAPGHVV